MILIFADVRNHFKVQIVYSSARKESAIQALLQLDPHRHTRHCDDYWETELR